MASHEHQQTPRHGESETRTLATLAVTGAGKHLSGIQLEDRLRASEERFRSLVVATGQLIWKTDGQGNVREDLPIWCAYTGQTQEDLLEGRWAEAVHPDDFKSVDHTWARALESREVYKMEFRIRRYDGVYRPFAVCGVPVLEPDGGVQAWIGICSDLTETYEVQTKLLESEKRFRDLADAMPLIVWTSQPDGTIDYYNQRWFTYSGMTFEQTEGQLWQLVTHPDDVQLCLDRWTEAQHNEAPYEMECRLRRFDGVYRWHIGRSLPVRDEAGRVILWVGTGTDIDDQKQFERKLLQRARQQALIAALSQQAVINGDLEALFNAVNAQLPLVMSATHCSIAQIRPDGMIVHHSIASDDSATHITLRPEQAPLTEYIFHASGPVIVNDCRTDVRFPFSSLLRTYNIMSCLGVVIAGQERSFGTLMVYCTEPRTFTQDDVHLLHAIANVLGAAIERDRVQTELEHANERLEYVNKAQNKFVSLVSHEFRTPLTSIQGFSELLRDEDFSAGEVKEYAADINTDARRLNRMITELLDLERMKSGRMTLNLEEVDLNTLIKDVIDHARPTSPLHQFLLELDEELPHLTADRDKLTQVVTNLISNAIKYSPNGGELIVSSGVLDGSIHVSVRDSGIGIPSDALEKVFDSYYRIESSESQQIKGTGLGLPIARQIVQMHGGRAWAESELGHGSTFHFTLPLAGGSTVPPETQA